MVDVSPCANEADEQRSLDVYSEVWPHDRIGLAEVRSFKASLRDHADLLARIEGEVVGSAFASI